MKRYTRWYAEAAVIVLSTLILLLGFTLLSYAYYTIRGNRRPTVYSTTFAPGRCTE